MGKIILLDEQTSCRIAAGEVVERPSSVVKELVENSIDAGSTRIKVEITKGGIKLIRVTDNGSGMEPDDCVIAFDKHATSKIRNADDLFNITTMGFRGEALASIAAVSRVTLNTKTANASEGTFVVIEGGELAETGSVGMAAGTRITVEDLFYNTPARYKFLKKDQTEASYVADVLEKIALAYPEISFTLISDKKQILYTPGGGNLRNAALGIFGREVTEKLIDISSSTGAVKVSGLCGSKDLTFGNRGRQIFFVNGRYIKSRLVTSAIDEAYKTLTMKGRFPFVILNIYVPVSAVDVNVHPAKTEVRFADENSVFRAVYHAVFDTLQGRDNAVINSVFTLGETGSAGVPAAKVKPKHDETDGREKPGSDASVNKTTDYAGFISSTKDVAEMTSGSLFNTTGDRSELAPGEDSKAGLSSADGLVQNGGTTPGHSSPKEDADSVSDAGGSGYSDRKDISAAGNSAAVVSKNNISVYKNGRVAGQIFDTYIVIEYNNRMYLLDQHAAHERLKYEEIKNALQNAENPSQMLLVPLNVRLSAKEFSVYKDCRGFFERLGFDIEEFSGNTLAVRSVPALIGPDAASEFIITALNSRKPGEGHINVFPDHAVYTMACKAAIKANRKLSPPEIEALLDDLIRVDNPGTCPHGRPILISFTQYEIERRFHRA